MDGPNHAEPRRGRESWPSPASEAQPGRAPRRDHQRNEGNRPSPGWVGRQLYNWLVFSLLLAMFPLLIATLALSPGQPWTTVLLRGEGFLLAAALVSPAIPVLAETATSHRLNSLLYPLAVVSLSLSAILFALTTANALQSVPTFPQLTPDLVTRFTFLNYLLAILLGASAAVQPNTRLSDD